MNAFALVWDKREEKPVIAKVKIHTITANVYIVKFNDYMFEKKYQTIRKENVFFNRNEARCEIQLENKEILRRNKYINLTLISK